MRLATDHADAEAIRGRHHRPLAHGDAADRDIGEHVQSEHGVRLEVLEQALFEHQRGAAFFAARRAFLRGLEYQQHFTRQILAHRHQRLGHAHQDAGVRVVATGVHHPDGLAAVGGRGLGGERQAGLFGYRQGIHVRTQRHPRSRLAALDDRGDAVESDAGLRLQAQLAQVRGDLRGGAFLAVGQFRVLVEVASPGQHLGLQVARGGGDFGALAGRGLLRVDGRQQRGAEQRHGIQGEAHHRIPVRDRPMLTGSRHRAGRATIIVRRVPCGPLAVRDAVRHIASIPHA